MKFWILACSIGVTVGCSNRSFREPATAQAHLSEAMAIATSHRTMESNPIRIDQGWNATQIDSLYHRNEGSEIMPLLWFLNLEKSGSSQKFVDDLMAFGSSVGHD